jgi:uncharacterized protein YeaO (DUF488 family)
MNSHVYIGKYGDINKEVTLATEEYLRDRTNIDEIKNQLNNEIQEYASTALKSITEQEKKEIFGQIIQRQKEQWEHFKQECKDELNELEKESYGTIETLQMAVAGMMGS